MIRASAAERNREPILEVLRTILNRNSVQLFLEIASGYGAHIGHFAPHFPATTFQPTDVTDDGTFDSIRAFSKEAGSKNIRDPLRFDVSRHFRDSCQSQIVTQLTENSVDVVYCANMIHISSNAAVDGLFRNAGLLLKRATGLLITYGPYGIDGVISPESNVSFDISLRQRNPEWGLRDTVFLKKLAADNKLTFQQMFDMPANNKVLLFKRDE